MRKKLGIGAVVAVGAAAAAVAAFAGLDGGTSAGSSQSPYLVPKHDGVKVQSIMTVGDPVGGVVTADLKLSGQGYRMTGLPDGLGAFEEKGGTFTVLMNHEISSGGATRAHGATGAFVSRWSIATKDLSVLDGGDLIQKVATWNGSGYNAPATGVALSRLCSADLPAESAFWDKKSRLGYDEPLFMNGEESGNEGRAFAHALDGTSYQLPYLGRFSWENSVAGPSAGVKTVVVGLDDSTPGQVYVYVGDKKQTGSPVERAGLTGGTLYGVKVPGVTTEPSGSGIASGTPFALHSFGDVSSKTGAALQSESVAAGVTEWQRPEDGAWDPKHPNDFYFVVTASFTGNSKLYRLRFKDATNPALGGTVDQLLTGTEDGGTGERFHMLDNLGIDRHGRIVLQEDPGGTAGQGKDYLARVWLYDIKSGELTGIAQHDPVRFSPASITSLTGDEESSGVIDAEEILGKGWFLLDVQAHYAQTGAAAPLVEGGQLLALYVPKIKGDDADDS